MIQSFIEAVDGGDELKDSVGVYSVLLFLYLFSFFLVSNTLLCVFILMVIKNCPRMLVLILILKIVLMMMNYCKFLIWCALFLFRILGFANQITKRDSVFNKAYNLFIALLNSYYC